MCCDVSNTFIDEEVIKKFNTKTIYESFYDTLKFSNYKVLFCYKLAFHINSINLINKGSFMAIIYFFIYLLFCIFFICKGIEELKLEYAKELFINKNVLSTNNNENEDNKNNED